jgi:hypothetical protein
MRGKKTFVLILFLLPIFLLACLIIYRGHHKPRRGILATANQLAQASREWNANDPQAFFDPADREAVKTRLRHLLSREDLTEVQVQEAESSASALLESLKTGDYDLFIGARLPSPEFTVSDDMEKALQRYSALANALSATAIENYKSIWNASFHTNALWQSILFNDTNSVAVESVTNAITARLEFPPFMESKDAFYVRSYVTIAFDYDTLQSREVSSKGKLQVLKLFFFGKDARSTRARPFMISLLWSSAINKWVPFDFSHGFVDNNHVSIRFF